MAAALLSAAGCGSAPLSTSAAAPSAAGGAPAPARATWPRTRAERTGYAETSHYADVIAFLDSLQTLGAPIRIGNLPEKSTEGRDIPFVIASRPLVATPAEAKRLGRPVIYLQANIHAGEVEGKEAVQELLRDLVFEARPNVLDSLVVLVVPIYNPDGNDHFGPETENRTEQNGPALIGQRPNGQGLDLNRDYVKAEAPETRGSLSMFNAWDPDVFVDLHTTDGSFHGYALTYSPSLHPAAALGPFDGGGYARDSLLPELRRRMRARDGFEIFDYGNFPGDAGVASGDSIPAGWYTYDHRPRFGTNYTGLRGRIAILSEAFSHDPLRRRVASTKAFVQEILSLAAERAPAILARSRAADSAAVAWGRSPGAAPLIPIRARLTTNPSMQDVLEEDLAKTGDSSISEPGVPKGLRRTGRVHAIRMPVWDRFESTLSRRPPAAYLLGPGETDAVRLLRLHGIAVTRLTAGSRVDAEVFTVDSAVTAAQPFQGHHEMRLVGRWRTETRAVPAGAFVVSVAQPLGVLAVTLLEPQSDDGLTTWNVFDRALRAGAEYPVARVARPVGAAGRLVP
jgi:Zinc carboxypeptidase